MPSRPQQVYARFYTRLKQAVVYDDKELVRLANLFKKNHTNAQECGILSNKFKYLVDSVLEVDSKEKRIELLNRVVLS